MQRADLLIAFLFGGTLLWAHPCVADGALAVGIPPSVKSGGFVWGYGVDSDSQKQALTICRGGDAQIEMPKNASEAQKRCTIVGSVRNQCFAIAQDAPNLKPVTAAGWDIAVNLLTAEDQALAMCKGMAAQERKAECRVTGRGCDGSAK